MRPDHRIAYGKQSELIAAAWLIGQGCYVYQPFIEQGPVDLVALTPEGEIHLFDVKTVSRRKDGSVISRTLKQGQQALGVRLLYVDRIRTNVTSTLINSDPLNTQPSKPLTVIPAGS